VLFNSYIFIFLFLPVTLLGYFGINKIDHKWGKLFLVMMSFVFYGYFNPYYLLIILGSIGVNYAIYKYVEKNTAVGTRKIALLAGLIFNIGLIFYYKYYDFFISNVNVVLGTDFNLLHILLPLGISFFTFQQVSFVVDAYYGRVGNITLLDYSLFVTFFPQLIAGPIVLHSEMLPQFAEEKNKYFNAENLVKGIMIFTMGLFKKIIIADTLGDFVGVGFANVRFMGSLDWLLIMFCYTFQIYFDFSGYSDMAIGLAAATGYIFFTVLFAIIMCVVLVILAKANFGNRYDREKRLKIVIPEDLDYDDVFNDIFKKYAEHIQLESTKTTNLGSMFELRYTIVMKKEVKEQAFLNEIRERNGNLPISLNVKKEDKGEL